MAARAPRPCRSPGCSALCRDGSGYCEEHKALKSNWSRSKARQRRPHDGNSALKHGGSTRAWRKIRERVLRRDKWLCQKCLSEGRVTQATDVDHIIRRHDGGTDELSNLTSLCHPCHKYKTAQERRSA